ncbi:hypothetical protein FYJ24_00570 [Actinomycetaceae bacterium WB03_NA08]|uniref:Uncharacterized protein n=1 Tax=Scrofimicrobium canadense TaxID=2652290 RepID=A0A6N7W4A4_9ACTO|nr:hypothetical protein [Scrofimicrobium canadense]MSS83282.1 hypothetical protein [Scrofimicrobium canadense]
MVGVIRFELATSSFRGDSLSIFTELRPTVLGVGISTNMPIALFTQLRSALGIWPCHHGPAGSVSTVQTDSLGVLIQD